MNSAMSSAGRFARSALFLVALALFIALPAARAQWKTETYPLHGGWNAIYLHGDASHATPAKIFENHPQVLEVWRWNPNPDQTGFTTSPSMPAPSSNEWTIWKRNDPDEQLLTAMIGQSAYMIYCSGASTDTYDVAITQKPMPPAATWLVTGANFLGFPASTSPGPVMSTYFASFPAAIATPWTIYKYIGGDISATNPVQVFPGSERLSRNLAYWFEAPVVSDFTAPVEYELPSSSGLAFGRTGNVITLGIKNRTTSAITLTFTPLASEPAPSGQPGVVAPVPLTRRTFDSTLNTYVETPVAGSFAVTLPASGRLDVEFGLDRTQMTAAADAHYASLLRVQDAAGFTDVYLPVSAQVTSPAGLWIGEVSVSSVVSQVAGSPGSTVSRSFPLRTILHVDADRVPRLLSQAYVGALASEGRPDGVATEESLLDASTKSSAMRLVSSQMPLDRVIVGQGDFVVGGSFTCVVTIPFNDPVNPFVHQYHPDHDNRDARLAPLPAGVESYDITRTCTFTLTSTPPDGSTVTGWGTTVYGGTYTETITGLHKNPLTVGGTFMLRRISEVSTLTVPTID